MLTLRQPGTACPWLFTATFSVLTFVNSSPLSCAQTGYEPRIHAPSIDMDDEALNQLNRAPERTKQTRRGFLKVLGVSSAGMTLANAAAASKEKIKQGGEDAKVEIEKLKKAYEELDRRSQLILRVVLVMSGLDIFM